MALKRALLILAEGAEEMEAVISADVLRRANVEVTIAGLEGKAPVLCSRKVVVNPDSSLKEAIGTGSFDVVILPGGLKGAEALGKSAEVGKILKEQEEAGRIVAAICAGPTALKQHGIGTGKNATSYPGVKNVMEESYSYKEDRVVTDGNLITSRGPGTAFEFALAIIDKLGMPEKVPELRNAMLLK